VEQSGTEIEAQSLTEFNEKLSRTSKCSKRGRALMKKRNKLYWETNVKANFFIPNIIAYF